MPSGCEGVQGMLAGLHAGGRALDLGMGDLVSGLGSATHQLYGLESHVWASVALKFSCISYGNDCCFFKLKVFFSLPFGSTCSSDCCGLLCFAQ